MKIYFRTWKEKWFGGDGDSYIPNDIDIMYSNYPAGLVSKTLIGWAPVECTSGLAN